MRPVKYISGYFRDILNATVCRAGALLLPLYCCQIRHGQGRGLPLPYNCIYRVFALQFNVEYIAALVAGRIVAILRIKITCVLVRGEKIHRKVNIIERILNQLRIHII